jgi:hypothetical protein
MDERRDLWLVDERRELAHAGQAPRVSVEPERLTVCVKSTMEVSSMRVGSRQSS